MKNFKFLVIILLPTFLLLGKEGIAQVLGDTIVTKYNDSIICKITKVTDVIIVYKMDNEPDAIEYEIAKNKVRKICFANGRVETVLKEKQEESQDVEIINKRSAIKFHFLSPAFNHLAFAYEMSIKPGLNIEITLSLINTSMFNASGYNELFPLFGNNGYSYLTQGGAIVIGPKFLLNTTYSRRGKKYTHPLKGMFFNPEIFLTSFSIRNVDYYDYYSYNYYYQENIYKSDIDIKAVSLILNYGNQVIIAKNFSFGFKVGVGYSFVSTKYSNPAVESMISSNNYNYYDYTPYQSNLFNQIRLEDTPLTFSTNISFGYLFK